MNKFDSFINTYLCESIVDIKRNSLDPTVFQFPDDGQPIMHPMIKTQIMEDIVEINKITPVNRFLAIGSILTPKYSRSSDIDINVEIEKEDQVSDIKMDTIFQLVKKLNGNIAAGTTHPLNYYIIQGEYDLSKTDAAYDVVNEKWIKIPEASDLNVQSYMSRFENIVSDIDLTASELRRNIIDFEELKTLSPKQINNLKERIEEKLNDIEDNVDEIIRTYKNIKDLRKKIFERDLSPAEIRKYGHKNKLPENVIYKLLERYYYFDFINKLKAALGEDEKIETKEVEQIKNAGKDFWK